MVVGRARRGVERTGPSAAACGSLAAYENAAASMGRSLAPLFCTGCASEDATASAALIEARQTTDEDAGETPHPIRPHDDVSAPKNKQRRLTAMFPAVGNQQARPATSSNVTSPGLSEVSTVSCLVFGQQLGSAVHFYGGHGGSRKHQEMGPVLCVLPI